MILDPCVVVAVMENSMLNCNLSVCENDSMHMSKGCFTNDLVELLKTKKHARIFVHMLEYFENQNHVLHNSISESKSLIKKYKRKNRMLCEMIESLKMKGQSERSMKPNNEFLFEGQECLSHVSLFVHTSLKVFGLPKFGEVKKTVYGACQMGKQTKASHHKVNVIATSWCLELLLGVWSYFMLIYWGLP